jgi:hypothetical protein
MAKEKVTAALLPTSKVILFTLHDSLYIISEFILTCSQLVLGHPNTNLRTSFCPNGYTSLGAIQFEMDPVSERLMNKLLEIKTSQNFIHRQLNWILKRQDSLIGPLFGT